ncbi:hypothetical protein SDRG_16146 [Saprolegnia diclina VS20]|uniref:Condensin complex subunit 1 C-terminal domain-containing protein n=1 Tax=Saprolegnia diclina (strain VS20) TaxID=1156394 RepID=T0PKY1_SAPDV|nr:hypothetical protein SDRG_16146 [Saprolegnia diclina VS20]EQC25999.1 hypothetical protein SDRG_16146 [Saprolegnia diclina VS20]|eukprot:XP_008620567.1 hypothetical protein SDRG_16146 [Saprolegnia diclina VS20]
MLAIANELRQGGAPALKAVQRLVQSEYIETALAPALVDLVRDAKTELPLRVPSFLALAKLCSNSDLDLHPAETLDPAQLALTVAEQLDHSDIRMQAAATLALSNLTTHQLALDEPVLQQVIKSLETIEHEGIQRAVLGYIGNAAASANARHVLINETNCIEQLSEFTQAGRGEPVRGAAAFTMGNLLSGRDVHAQNMLREVDGLPSLILLLSPAYSEDTNECSAWAISHGVHRNTLNQDLVGDAGGIGMLLHHLVSPNDDLRRNAILALYSSAVAHADNIDRVKRGEGDVIVEQLLTDESPECREYATLLLQEF